MTLPVSTTQVVLGKFLAAWCFIALAVALTFPMWITVNYLGDPDNGVILASYVGSLLMAGAFLAIGSCVSAFTKNQVIAFIVAAVVCFLFLMSGLDFVLSFFQGWLPQFLVDTVASMSFLTHFSAITRGMIDLRDIVFFGSLIGVALFVNTVVVDIRKGQ
jgi:ABC-2 type transport system permease protein